MSGLGGTSGLAGAAGALSNATPWGAAANALGAAIATPNTSATGAVSTGGTTVGGFSFNSSDHSGLQYAVYAIAAVVGVMALSMLGGRRRKRR